LFEALKKHLQGDFFFKKICPHEFERYVNISHFILENPVDGFSNFFGGVSAKIPSYY